MTDKLYFYHFLRHNKKRNLFFVSFMRFHKRIFLGLDNEVAVEAELVTHLHTWWKMVVTAMMSCMMPLLEQLLSGFLSTSLNSGKLFTTTRTKQARLSFSKCAE